MARRPTLAPQPWMIAEPTRAVMAALAPGGEARFVGGSVRDALAGRKRIGDVDIATPSPPERAMELLAAANIRAIPTGIEHGTITAVLGDAHFEITTLRRDVRTFGRHAEVAFTDDWREDASRRDFTMNAMSLTAAGELFDYFGGEADLAAGRVRFVGEASARVREDVLRILRFFRFHAHYGKGAPDGEALAAASAAAALVPDLSGERVWAELQRILCAPDPAAALALMEGAGVLAHVLPYRRTEGAGVTRLAALAEVEAAEGLADTPDAVRRLAAVLRADADAAAETAARLKLSRADRERLDRLVRRGASVAPDMSAAEARREVYRSGADLFRDLALLSWAGEQAEARDRHSRRDASAAFSALLEAAHGFAPPVFPLSGKNAQAMGLAPGPAMGRALAAVENWWIERDFRAGRDELLARLEEEIRKG